MTDDARTNALLRHGVPLTLLFDLAGFGPTSEELYRSESSRAVQDEALLVAVAS